ATKTAITGARVSAAGGVAMVTDDDGLFTLEVSTAGRVTLFVRRLGYDSASVDVDAPTPAGTRYLFELHRASETLDTVTVAERAASWSPKLEGFEHRLATHNSGTFFTHQQIEQRNPLSVSDVVRRAPGVRVMDSLGVRLFASGRGNKMVDTKNGRRSVPCIMRVGVDGHVMEWGFAA